MEDAPITFEHQGKKYVGSFDPVFGGGATNVWDLMIDKYYCGRLRLSIFNNEWVFDPTPKTKSFVELTEYFGDYITAWYC